MGSGGRALRLGLCYFSTSDWAPGVVGLVCVAAVWGCLGAGRLGTRDLTSAFGVLFAASRTGSSSSFDIVSLLDLYSIVTNPGLPFEAVKGAELHHKLISRSRLEAKAPHHVTLETQSRLRGPDNKEEYASNNEHISGGRLRYQGFRDRSYAKQHMPFKGLIFMVRISHELCVNGRILKHCTCC